MKLVFTESAWKDYLWFQENYRNEQLLSASGLFDLFSHRKPSKPVSIEDMEAAN